MVKILKKNGQKSFNLILNYIIKKLKSINYVKYNISAEILPYNYKDKLK